MIRDFTDAEARERLVLKWGIVPDDVLPAWVAEMDFAVHEPIRTAVGDAVAGSALGYPVFGATAGAALGSAYAGFAARHYGHQLDPSWVLPVVDVTAGVRLAVDVLSEPGPVITPTPCYPPMLEIGAVTGKGRVDVPIDPDSDRAALDLVGIERELAAGARTVILINPHNPWGRAFTRPELEALRDLVTGFGARVVADEIHAPLVLPGAEHIPYLSLPGTADHAVAVVAASKAFNTAGLRCAQVVVGDDATRDRLASAEMSRNDSWSPLGVIAARVAYAEGDEWLAALIERLAAQRDLYTALLAEHLPAARTRPLEATFLSWLDLRGYGHDDPATIALERGRVQVSPGHDFEPGLPGHVRVNLATSPERLTEIVRRLASALS